MCGKSEAAGSCDSPTESHLSLQGMLSGRKIRCSIPQTGEIGGISPNPRNPIFLIFPGVLEPGRYPRGFLDPVGLILVEYEPEPSHMDLIQTRFHDFL